MDDNRRIKEYTFNIERCLRITSVGYEKVNNNWLHLSDDADEERINYEDILKSAEILYNLAIEKGGRNLPNSIESLFSLLESTYINIPKDSKESLESLLRALEVVEARIADQTEKINQYEKFLFSTKRDKVELISSFYTGGCEKVVVEWKNQNEDKIKNFFKVFVERPSKNLLKKILSTKLINIYFVFSLGQGKEISFLMDCEACYSANFINYPEMTFYKYK
jgi:hypothetical protein